MYYQWLQDKTESRLGFSTEEKAEVDSGESRVNSSVETYSQATGDYTGRASAAY